MNLAGPVRIWKKMQDDMITYHNHVATVSYPSTITGTPANFDSFFQEGTDGKNPSTHSATVTAKASITVTGIAFLDAGSVAVEDMVRTNIGFFIPGRAIFLCKISDATVDGKNIFEGADKLTVLGETFIIENWVSSGLGTPYVYNVILRKTNG